MADGRNADSGARIRVTGGPWPERIGCLGRAVLQTPGYHGYPWAEVVRLDDDPLMRSGSFITMRRIDIEVLPDGPPGPSVSALPPDGPPQPCQPTMNLLEPETRSLAHVVRDLVRRPGKTGKTNVADRHPRWYGNLTNWSGPTGVVQISGRIRRAQRSGEPLTLPEPLLRLAQAEYDIRFPGQPYEEMQKRGGLGILEVVALLADALERKGGPPPW